MIANALKSLTIEHLRGSVTPFRLEFEKSKKLTVVYGDNGTGKTTICDALEFLGKGKVGSLDGRGLGKTNRYWHSLGKSPSDVAVILETTVSNCSARISKSEVTAVPLEHRPHVEVLRRNQILALVQAKPGERYDAIKRFIDVSGIETSEESLRELIRILSKDRDLAIARVQENQDTINQFWEETGKPSPNAIAWAQQESVRDTAAINAEHQALGKLLTSYRRLPEDAIQFRNAISKLNRAQERLNDAARALNNCLSTIAEDANETLSILEAARPFLERNPKPSQCPLCESSEKVDDLSNRLDSRLAQFVSLQTARNEKRSAELAVQEAERTTKQIEDEINDHQNEFEFVRSSHEWQTDVPLPNEICPAEPMALVEWVRSTCQLSAAWADAQTRRQDKKQFLSTLQRAFATFQTNLEAQKQLDQFLPRLNRALEIIAEERRKFTDEILAKIAQEVGRLYEAVHPGEGLNKVSLELDPSKRASLEIGVTFCGQNSPPQAYFSDSHLDTLGLCIFLALARLDNSADTILVLDDVLGSVDEPHVDRLIEMFYEEALAFRHCILTTHYRPWKQKLRWGWLQNGQCQYVELTKWTTTTGLALARSLPDVARLKQLLGESPPDSQLVCAKAGVVLEAALDFLTQLYECSIPRRANGLYTLGDLLPAVDHKLRRALKVEVRTSNDSNGAPTYQTTSLTPILDELSRIAQARNVFGCHFNAMSFELLDADAIGFGQHVLALMEALTDADAGWPRNKKSGSYWATAGETRRLHPLSKPT